jgi:hypothetical protein
MRPDELARRLRERLDALDRSDTSVRPAGSGTTGPVETVPAETGPAETGPAVVPPAEIGPAAPIAVPEITYPLDLNTGETTPLPKVLARGSEYAASPDGSRLAYTARGDHGGSQIFVANLDGTGIEQVTHDLKPPSSLVWSPDGSKIAYIQATNEGGDAHNLFVLDLATGTSTQLTFATSEPGPAAPDLGPWMVSSASFTPDGSSIVYGISRGDNIDYGEVEVRMVPVAGGKSELLIRDEHDDGVPTIDAPRLSPDGSLLSYSSGPLVSSAWPTPTEPMSEYWCSRRETRSREETGLRTELGSRTPGSMAKTCSSPTSRPVRRRTWPKAGAQAGWMITP